MTEPDAVATAEEFARQQAEEYEALAAEREYNLRRMTIDCAHGRVLAAIWAPVVLLVVLAFFAWTAFIVHQVSDEHVRQVKVVCYADPNSNNATSEFTGTRSNVEGICPDAKTPAPTYGGNP